eukprot:TRINITY_DN49388_c0_g1_i1.p1 TRINITY_DN49388_c0_g1~~TRINITY_DN49388_c0_g1_i1.p1  ORF type:complete len:332 (-),score=32.08 TRINITY_DN49388_c0_g1_i1:9-1004(-)
MEPTAMRVACGYNGLELAVDVWGNFKERGTRVVVFFLHGGGQTRHSWDDSARTLAKTGRVCITLDSKGHGDSYWDPRDPSEGYSMAEFACDLESLVSALELDVARTFFVGASHGGLTMLHCPALLNQCAGSVLVDVAIQLQGTGVSRILNFMLDKADEGFATVREAADAVNAYQSHRRREITPQVLAGLQKNLRQRPNGRWYWHWDPNFLQTRGSVDPVVTGEIYDKVNANDPSVVDHPLMIRKREMEESARKLKSPVLLVRGRMSDVVSTGDVQHMRSLVPHLRYVDVQDASHMVAGDSNDVFSRALVSFVGDNEPRLGSPAVAPACARL